MLIKLFSCCRPAFLYDWSCLDELCVLRVCIKDQVVIMLPEIHTSGTFLLYLSKKKKKNLKFADQPPSRNVSDKSLGRWLPLRPHWTLSTAPWPSARPTSTGSTRSPRASPASAPPPGCPRPTRRPRRSTAPARPGPRLQVKHAAKPGQVPSSAAAAGGGEGGRGEPGGKGGRGP